TWVTTTAWTSRTTAGGWSSAVRSRSGRPTVPEPRRYTDEELAAMSPRRRAEALLAQATPEELDAQRAQWARDAEAERVAERAHARWAAYTRHRPDGFANASYNALFGRQNPEGRISGWWE